MAMTNRGVRRRDDVFWRGQNVPTNFYAALVTNATPPTRATNTLGQLTEIAAGNGYTSGGIQLSRNTTDFPSLVEDDDNNQVTITIKDLLYTASSGSIPPSGDPAAWLVITDDNATVGNREVLAYYALGGTYTMSDGQTLTATGVGVDSFATADS